MASSAPPTEQQPDAARRTLLFRVGGTIYGCDIEAVREIVPFRRPTRLPGAPAYVQGLINLRGNIVMVFDLAVRLEPGHPSISEGSIMLVSVGGARVVGFAVQEVMDVRVLGRSGDVTEASWLALRHGDDDGVVRGLGQLESATEGESAADVIGAVGSGTVILLDIHMLAKQVLLS